MSEIHQIYCVCQCHWVKNVKSGNSSDIWMGITVNDDDGTGTYLVKFGGNGNNKCIYFPTFFWFKAEECIANGKLITLSSVP